MANSLVFTAIALLIGSTLEPLIAAAQAQRPLVSPSSPSVSEIVELRRQLAEQAREIEALKRSVTQQRSRQADLERAVAARPPAGPGSSSPAQGTPEANTPQAVAGASPRPVRIGQPPSEPTDPELWTMAVAPLFDQPGVLTPQGRGVLEPSFQYAYSSSNQVALVGYTVIPSLPIGWVDVRQLKQHTFTTAITGRYGVTNRFELEAKVPYVYRSNSAVSREIFTGSATGNVFNTSGRHLGDVQVTARYQLNQGGPSIPYMIGALRFKSRTGKDPFDVVTDCATRCIGNTTGTGLPLDLPTGSGFYTPQPGLTWLFASDPVVFFGSFSYAYNFKRTDVSRVVRDGQREFLGTGLALNDRSSFSIGVDLASAGRVKQNGVVVPGSVRTQLGTLMMGYSYRYDARRAINSAVGAGLTRDTPDLTLTARIPFSV